MGDLDVDEPERERTNSLTWGLLLAGGRRGEVSCEWRCLTRWWRQWVQTGDAAVERQSTAESGGVFDSSSQVSLVSSMPRAYVAYFEVWDLPIGIFRLLGDICEVKRCRVL